MKIVLTNDDGYNAEGIQYLYHLLQKYGDVYLVAPHHHMSGASVSRVFWTKVKVHQHEEKIFSVEGTPADSVSLAFHGLNIRPDVVISGVNSGFNLGADTVYSGTVGACMESLKFKIPAIALSADYDHLEQAKKDIESVLDFIFKHNLLSKDYLLNVNFVSKKFKKSKGIQLTDLGFRDTRHYYVAEDDHYVTKRYFLNEVFTEGTDLHAVNHGYISITPLKFANQTQEGLNELRKKVSQLD
ncbi:MAG: 5'/3'-nucleotidase SurE [Candidatus Izemoplasmatales bacterium]|uniref:5'-nucleotidase SurE n=1 Tax=Hujiaoplasma nucleasis TaxID=2725268 RepID=A0A7L6N4X6_9MOLU|nr:5'/3'-nucleotidase SurE [Hujiaoplasma nucleasis]QLY39629.1 5'/3'-nucleotidase SurE [Hujiaoplasma nucleasis]